MRRPADNPFRSACIDQLRYIPQDKHVDELFERLQELNYHASLLGKHGTGKTCLLDALELRLQESGKQTIRIHINADREKPSVRSIYQLHQDNTEACILIDGADSLPRFAWQRIKWKVRHAPGLIVTSHERKILPPLHRQNSNPEILQEILSRLVDQPNINAQDLWHRHAGNLRECLRQCYLDWQAQLI